MRIQQKKWTSEKGWEEISKTPFQGTPQLVLVFGGSNIIKDPKFFNEIRSSYPSSHIAMMSSAGEIADITVSDNTLSLVAIEFEKSSISCVKAHIENITESEIVGKNIASQLSQQGLVHVLVFSDGLRVNGTNLVKGMNDALHHSVPITGGLVGDGSDFKHTYVGLDESPQEGEVIAIGLYGEALRVSYGSRGGWDIFGPERIVTRAKDNVLYELDGKPALDIYKEYLGDRAKDLPSSGLLFPLNVHIESDDGGTDVVRTILAVNESEKSLIFAGTIPERTKTQLMRANFDRLVTGAADAASMISKSALFKPQFALLVSCVGRKLVLRDRIEEEIEAIRDAFGPDTVLAGFYSYGEISPVVPSEKQCVLHNQTMTITAFAEV